jgi:hypothetical protein
MHPVIRAILQGLSFAMRIATSATGTDFCYFEKTSLVNSTKTTAVESLFRVETSGSTECQQIVIRNGTKSTGISIKLASIICNFTGTGPYTHSVDTTVDHIYKIELQGTTQAVFYVDGVAVHTASYANLGASATNSIYWGDGSTTANKGGSLIWKSFKYNLDLIGTPAAFVEWDSSSKPNTQGWTLNGTDLATIIEE